MTHDIARAVFSFVVLLVIVRLFAWVEEKW